MAKLRINQGLNLTLDASTTDFIVKSLSGSGGDLLLNGRSWSVEIRIDEDNSGSDIVKITKGSGGSTRLLTVENSGNLNIGGFDLKLGTTDQSSRGNSGSSRALSKDTSATLVINYAGDFTGGTRVDGPGLGVGGTNYVYNTNTSYQIPGADANAKWLIVKDTSSGAGVISFNNTKDANGNILGSLVWTREGGQSDGHRQVAGIVAVQSGTGTTAGSELRFYTKASSGPSQRMVIDKNGNVGIGVTAPTERVETDGNVKAVKFISTAAAGVPPLQVSSTTKVDNLNADLLDGYDSTDFPRKAENAVISGTWNFNTIGINKSNPEYRLVVEEAGNPIAAAIRKTNSGNGGGLLDGPTLLVENSYGNHSWGNLAEFRIGNNGGTDPPNITFTAGWASTGWAVGMAGNNDADFGIASNRGWRFGNFGTVQLRVKSDGQLITRGTITPGISSSFAGHINGSGPIKFSNGSAAQEIYVRKVRASASWATNDANDPGDGGGFFDGNLIVNGLIRGNLSQIRFSDKRTINVYVDHGGDSNTRYYYLGKISTGAGILKVQGIMGGHTWDQGRANVDLQFSARDGFRVDGEVIGKLGQADIYMYNPNDGYYYIYLVTNTWALVNLELSAAGAVSIAFDGTFSYSQPTFNGNTFNPGYKLSTDGFYVLRYTSRLGNDYFPVSFSTSGITVTGQLYFYAYAQYMGPLILITIFPIGYPLSTDDGFTGEGTITFSMDYANLASRLQLPNSTTLYILSAFTTTQVHTNVNWSYDHEYQFVRWAISSGNFTVQLFRQRYGSYEGPSVPHVLLIGVTSATIGV
jgi:hypothetical protein